MSEYLPQELMLDIFTRLPIKSILRCTSLCKSWYSLLTSSNFISMHLNRKQDEHILVRHFSRNPEKEIYSLFCDNENLDQYAQYDLPFNCSNFFFNIVGSCNGIFCLNDEMSFCSAFYLWNPSIRKSVKLPNPTFRADGSFDPTLGFGFDPVTNDYKVVKVLHTTYGMPPTAELYKLSTGVWKDISHVALSHVFFSRAPRVYLNRASHWVASRWEEGSIRSVIVSFDMHDETFSVIMLPSLVSEIKQYCEGTNLFVLDESLCLVNYNYDGTIDMWMMKEYGEAESWVKQYNISSRRIPYQPEVSHYLIKLIATRKNGEMLWAENDGLLLSVDHANQKIKDLGVRDSLNTNYLSHYSLYVNSYKESLVLLDKWRDYCAEDACEESFNSRKRELKRWRKKLLKTNAKRRLRVVSLLHISGLLYLSKTKGKWSRRKERKKRQVKRHPFSIYCP
ncbi:F-box protein CPR1-like isoform X1 [Lycium barbarum]|uniref:F-box protein CPR1-like isoform X1 n=1 Tax=Lycium barbarum TaxID=112863 RepID=UPI00293F6CAF|nr:F-box protein CPR1-like isoform X1 [Lycium barbarum]XP_060186994.1 F-box protein CPR1-like isoform X1 [Lycium barbarum]